MKAIGYTRVSTEQQADGGVSLDAQKKKIEAMATVRGADLVEIIVDAGASGKNLKRSGAERLLDMVNRKEIDAVIILKLDRLTRSVKDLAELLEVFDKRGVSLISVEESLDTGTAAGRLVLNVMASVSQWEREVIGERTSSALQHKKSQGERVGTVPFGYRLDADGVHFVADAQEQAIFSRIIELRKSGLSLRAISEELNLSGFQTRSGSEWKHQYVAGLLREAA